MIYVVLAWVFWFLFCLNIGFFVLGIIVGKKRFEVGFFYNFWFGLFILLVLLQLVSIFYPLNGKVLLFLSLVSLFIFWGNLKNLSREDKNLIREELNGLFDYRKIFIFLGLALFLSFLSNNSVKWYDTHLYHLNAVRWLADYGTVRGLANLHARLGINNVTFLLAAIMDNGIFNGSSSHLLNSFLLSVFSFQLLLFLFNKGRGNSFISLFVLFTFLILSMFSDQINSLSTDFSLVVFVLMSAFYTLLLDKEHLVFLIPLYVLAATTKFSYFPALLVLLIFVLFELRGRFLSRCNIGVLFFVFVFFLGFVIRNLLLSGWMFFPLPVLGINFPWQVPIGIVRTFNDTVRSWARLPGPKYLSSLDVSFWNWFIVWFNNNRNNLLMYYIFVLIILVFIYLFYRGKKKNKFSKAKRSELLLVISLVSLFYVFVTAPDFRFMGVFISLSISLILSFLLSEVLLSDFLRDLTLVVFLFLISYYLLKSVVLEEEPKFFVIRKEESNLVKPVDILYSDQRFYIWTPVNGDQCGNSQLPCSPYLSGFKMFESGNVKSGFYFTSESPIDDQK